jgi:hypothetical protein
MKLHPLFMRWVGIHPAMDAPALDLRGCYSEIVVLRDTDERTGVRVHPRAAGGGVLGPKYPNLQRATARGTPTYSES